MLLVLDNCEHLIEPVAGGGGHPWRCPGVRILATSREALAVPGEVQLPVAPLPVPPQGPPPSGSRSSRRPGCSSTARPRCAPTWPQDGLRLTRSRRSAAGWTASRWPWSWPRPGWPGCSRVELAERVRDRFAVLTSGNRTAEARQRTLRNTVDWSYDLLTPAEQVLFRRLAVFRGGWTLTAAETVVTDTELPAAAVLELLERLVRQSLVVADQAGGHTRYRMLETLRQYAAGKLADAGETTAMDAAHAAYFLAWVSRPRPGCVAPRRRSGWPCCGRSTRTCAPR